MGYRNLFLVLILGIVFTPAVFTSTEALPTNLTDATFWKMVSDFSEEPAGTFPYDNFVSNEGAYPEVIASLKKVTKAGGVYLGVGPEQNFTYAAALEPQLVFIIDIRRQNMIELLMYKALFELAPDRAEFVGLLFSRKRPPGLDRRSSVNELFTAYAAAQSDPELYRQNLVRIKERLIEGRGFQLTTQDQHTLDYVYSAFSKFGPGIDYAAGGSGPAGPSYAGLMTATDSANRNWSYLATENNFQFVRGLQQKNLIVPLVGDFGGDKTIRAVGRYISSHESRVTAFYRSNVEQYIFEDETLWTKFCQTVAALPLDASSYFIRSVFGRYTQLLDVRSSKSGFTAAISPMADFVRTLQNAGKPSYEDVLRMSK